MVNMENPGIQPVDVWRKLADFTPAIVANPDAGAVWVTMHSITGRGTWISMGWDIGSGVEVQFRYNLDGAGLVTDTVHDGNFQPIGAGMVMFVGFDTSLVVEMRLSGAGNAIFTSVAVVE